VKIYIYPNFRVIAKNEAVISMNQTIMGSNAGKRPGLLLRKLK